MSFWRHIPFFDRRRRNKGKGSRYPTFESKPSPQRRKSDQSPRYPTYRKPKRRRLHRRIKKIIFYAAAIFAVYVAWVFYSLPDIDKLGKFSKAPSILIKSEDGQIIGSFGDIYGEYIPFSQLPSSLLDAVVATEDRNFYHHFGIDPFGLLRAAVADVRARHVVQGGSTITQQVAKNVFLTSERSFSRKIKEMMLALKLERRYSKQEILSIYLNRVYLGAGNYGVDAAAHRYFDKSARELTLPESAIIAGLLKAPSRFAPTSDPILATKRADQVLINMQDARYLTEEQLAKAHDDLAMAMSERKRNAQSTLYFADWIADQIPDYIGNIQEDLVVTTTLRPDWQLLAEKAVNEVMDKDGPDRNATQAALLAMTPDGAVRAMVGGRSYGKSQYNRATQSLRQPGSAFKLFVYLTALEAGMTPDTEINDEPVHVRVPGGVWEPKNYEDKYLGPVTLKTAVAQSLNTVSVQVALRVGIDNVISMARRLGITSDLDPVPSIALGSTEVSLLELTAAYAHLAANGTMVYPYGIISIETADGEPVYQREASGAGQALSSHIVGEMNQLLLGVTQNGTGRAAQIGRPVAGKTGTTSDYRDAWFIGYTPALVTGVWVGNDNNDEMEKVTGGTLPAHIFHDFMMVALENVPSGEIPTSGGFFSLPWQGTADFPQQPSVQQHDLPPAQPSPQEDRKPEGHSVILGPDFWNKLMR